MGWPGIKREWLAKVEFLLRSSTGLIDHFQATQADLITILDGDRLVRWDFFAVDIAAIDTVQVYQA